MDTERQSNKRTQPISDGLLLGIELKAFETMFFHQALSEISSYSTICRLFKEDPKVATATALLQVCRDIDICELAAASNEIFPASIRVVIQYDKSDFAFLV